MAPSDSVPDFIGRFHHDNGIFIYFIQKEGKISMDDILGIHGNDWINFIIACIFPVHMLVCILYHVRQMVKLL